jgi:hypothetical protein
MKHWIGLPKDRSRSFLFALVFLVIGVSIVLQNPFDSAYPVANNNLQFWSLNLTEKCDDALKKILWGLECLADERILDLAEKPEVRKVPGLDCKAGAAYVKGDFGWKSVRSAWKNAHGSCPDEHEVEAHADFSIARKFPEVGHDFDIQKIDWWSFWPRFVM